MTGSDPTATTRRPGGPGNRGVQLFQGWSISFRGSVARVDGVVEPLSGESCRARSDSSGGKGHQQFPLPWTCNVDTCTTDARVYSFEFQNRLGPRGRVPSRAVNGRILDRASSLRPGLGFFIASVRRARWDPGALPIRAGYSLPHILLECRR